MTAIPHAPRPADSPDGDRVRSYLMQASLKSLLDQVRGSREVLPHLAALEISLGKRGLAAIQNLEPRVLGRICSQLSSLPVPKDDAPLLDLLTRLMDALGVPDRPRQAPTPVVDDSRMMVTEVSHSDFMRVAFEQATTRLGEP
jgi:hypothetical protein